MVLDRKKIYKKYMKKKFWLDVLALAALFLDDSIYINMVYVKFLRLKIIIKDLDDRFNLK